MRSVFTNDYRIAWRDRRRRNCLTETTRTRFRRAILIKSRSRLRSSYRVTRYCDLPTMAASKISSSSGSRQSLSLPEVCTSVAQAAIKRINTSASRGEYSKRRSNRGLTSTSPISVSWENDVTALNLSRLHAVTTRPGGPEGLRKAETQTLVSSRATSGTAVCLCLGPSFGDLRLNFSLRDCFCPALHPAQQTLQFFPPATLWVKGKNHLGLFFQPKRAKRFEHAFFKDCFERFVYRQFSFRQCHKLDYIDHAAPGSMGTAVPLCEKRGVRGGKITNKRFLIPFLNSGSDNQQSKKPVPSINSGQALSKSRRSENQKAVGREAE